MTDRRLTGRHVLAIFTLGFGTIIAVNLTLAVKAVQTFPGLEVANSYVASQSFDARRAAQDALGWQVTARYDAGQLLLRVTDRDGTLIAPARYAATIGRSTTRAADHPLAFDATGRAAIDLAPGRWRIDLQSAPGAPPFTRALHLEVAP